MHVNIKFIFIISTRLIPAFLLVIKFSKLLKFGGAPNQHLFTPTHGPLYLSPASPSKGKVVTNRPLNKEW